MSNTNDFDLDTKNGEADLNLKNNNLDVKNTSGMNAIGVDAKDRNRNNQHSHHLRVLLIEDELLTTRSLRHGLSTRNIVSDAVSLGQHGIDVARLYDYHVIVLDLMLPDIDGYEVLLRLRAAKVKVPVIILSGLATSDHITKGLNLGADDYLTKPFNIDELVARIHSLVRRSKSNIQTSLKVSDLVINFDTKIVECRNKSIRLTDKESQVLELLITRRGTVLGKEVFINHIYSPHGKEDKANPKNVDVFICKLRNKLKELTGHPDENFYIETVWGRGYMFRDTEIKQSSYSDLDDENIDKPEFVAISNADGQSTGASDS